MDATVVSSYTDFQGIARLKAKAREDSAGALDEVAQEFESLLLQMMLKSMREASQGSELMDSDQSLFYRDMYDQQLTLHLAKSGGLGLSGVIKRQLGGPGTEAPEGRGLEDYRQQAVSMPQRVFRAPEVKPEPELKSPDDFVQQFWPLARKAAEKLGQAPDGLLAQAALETGWGRNLIRSAAGDNSHNLFGIKADHRWPGERVAVSTLEFEQGVAVHKKESFRSYDSFERSFDDYADFLLSSPRYRKALAAGDSESYFSELQKAGYATDPRYAEKIVSLLNGPQMKGALERLKEVKGWPL